MAEYEPANLAQALDGLTPKGKMPASARVLNTWITQAQDRLGLTGPHWEPSFAKAAESAELTITLDDAVAQVNAWLERIGDA